MGELGLQWSTSLGSTDIFFLGYPDARTTQVANSTTGITADGTGLHTTYARAGDGSSADSCRGDFGYLLNGQHSTLDRVAFARDMDDLLDLTQPADIYTHATFEGHADHREVARQVIAAVIRSHDNVTVHGTLIHPEGTDGCSTLSSFQWPNPAGDTATDPGLRFTPSLDFTAPPTPTCSSSPTSTSWGPAGAPTETPTVPTSMQAASEASNLKWKAISDYASQLNCQPPGPNWHFSCGYMRAFVKRDEIFWDQQFGVGLPLSYENTVIADPNLDSLWRFGEGSGTVATATHGSHPGAYVNAALASPGLLTDDADTAAGFDATASVDFGDVYDFSGTAPFTLEAWVKPTTVDATARRIFSKEPAGGTEGWFLIDSASDTLKFARIHGGDYDTVTTDAPLDANATSYVAVTYDGTNIRLFVNGVQEAVSPSTGALADTAAAFTVGAKTGGSDGEWEGTIDEPAVYAAALTPATITNHYLAGIDAAGPPDPTAPGKPAAPTASAQDEVAHVDLPTPNPEADLASYTLERKGSSAPASAWSEVATGITTWPVTTGGIANGVSYDYRVIALDASGNLSTPSDPVSVTAVDTIAPARPAAPTATPLDGGARIALPALNTDGDLASYTLERRFDADPGSPWGTAATGVTTWPVTDGALGNGSAYDYRVIAVDTSGLRSTASPTVTVTPAAASAPSAPAPEPDPILPPTPTVDTIPPSLRFGATTTHSARYVLRTGLRVRLRCSEACTVRARLLLDAAVARRAGLTRRLVADRRIALGAGDSTTVVLKLSSAARRRLARMRTTATLRLLVVDTAGNAASSSRRIVLR